MTANLTTLRFISVWIGILLCGYILPMIHCINIIQDRDMNQIKRLHLLKGCLTYWSVFMFTGYFERILQWLYILLHFQTVPQLPYELRFIYLVFLSNGGSDILYTYLLHPLFKDHETLIDQSISFVISKVQTSITRHFQNIMWQILFAPNDGIISGTIKQFLPFILNQWL